MQIYEKAKELGTLISESKELLALRESEVEMLNDPKAMELLNEFNSLREEYVQSLSETDDTSKIEELKKNLVDKNNELLANAVTKKYVEAKNKLDNIFKTVSDILYGAVNGNEEGGCGSSCGSGCSGCGCS